MAFKLKSGNKPKFKEIGSSPLKGAFIGTGEGLADAEYHYNPDAPYEGVLGEEEAEVEEPVVTPETKKEEEVKETEEGTAEETTRTLPKGTGEEYKSRKQRRAEKQYHKEQAKAAAGPKKWWQLDKIGPEARRRIKQNKLEQKQTEARSKGTTSYNLKYSLGQGVQESLEPKADRLQRKIDKLEEKKPGSEVSKTKTKTEAMREERKAERKKGRATRKAERQAKRSAKKGK